MENIKFKIVDIIYYHTTICILLTILGSFVRTLNTDNIISLKEIFRQILLSIFMALITVFTGSIYSISKDYQYLICMGSGVLGIRYLSFFTEKMGKSISTIGKVLTELGSSVEKYSIPDANNKSKKTPGIQDIPDVTWRSTPINKNNPIDEEEK